MTTNRIDIEMLKQIALKGGSREHVALSSGELGELLGISQQSASKRLLNLLKSGVIARELGARRQMVRLTRQGTDLLRKEYSHYRRIFETGDKMAIRGSVITGLGEGQYYVGHREYTDQFLEKLGFRPYSGTLNVKVSGPELAKLHTLRNMDGVVIRGFHRDGRTFGDVMCFPATIKSQGCAVIIPMRSHYADVVEIISRYHLRRTLGLADGDEIEISLQA